MVSKQSEGKVEAMIEGIRDISDAGANNVLLSIAPLIQGAIETRGKILRRNRPESGPQFLPEISAPLNVALPGVMRASPRKVAI